MKASTIDIIERALVDIHDDVAEIGECIRRAGGDGPLLLRLQVIKDHLERFGAELDKRKTAAPPPK
jgi:hypothetical protein